MHRFASLHLPARTIPGFLVWLLVLAPTPAFAAAPSLEYVSPLPASNNVLPETNLIVRPGGIVDAGLVAGGALVTASGSASGPHAGSLRLADDGQTITFRPDLPFAPGEVVTCRIGGGLRTAALLVLPATEYQFTIAGP